jgi:hypothetical protein
MLRSFTDLAELDERIDADRYAKPADQPARDGVVGGNRFARPRRRATRRGADRGLDATALVHLSDCLDVRLEGNTVVDRGPHGRKLVQTMPASRQVVGAEGGVRSAPSRARQ